MEALRNCSSRARITSASFTNEYHWGDFKGDEDVWIANYFDAFVYYASWGTRTLKLRLPSDLLDAATAKAYCCESSACVKAEPDKVILTFEYMDEDGGSWGDCEDCEICTNAMSSLISVRTELARGDLRLLYLGWLLCVQFDEIDDDMVEPPVPPGLGQLSSSLQNLAEFLHIDFDLLHVAAETSPVLVDTGIDQKILHAWIGELPSTEKDNILTELMLKGNHAPIAVLLQRFLKTQTAQASPLHNERTVGQLRQAAELYAAERRRIEIAKQAKEKARQEREAAIARQKHIHSLIGSETKLWTEINALVEAKNAKSYDRALQLILDLQELAIHSTSIESIHFAQRVKMLYQTQARKAAFIERLRKAGLQE
ncbi:MAG: hypothetical protein FWC40_00855 [Proteobacteria bacterium]|nr:hypothetical protein [Pseudomonadota bacterium]